MTRAAQKLEERNVLEWYLANAGVPATFIGSAEPPDFILQIEARRVGVELVSYTQGLAVNGYPLRQTEGVWSSFQKHVRKVRAQYPSLVGVGVRLEFRPGLMPPGQTFDALIAEIAAMTEIKKPSTDFEYRKPSSPMLVKYVAAIRICNVGCYMDWTYSGNSGSIGVSDDEVAAIVRTKGQKLEKIRRDQIDALWLVVYGGHTISRMLDYIHDDMDQFMATVREAESGLFERLVLIGPDIRWWEASKGWHRIVTT